MTTDEELLAHEVECHQFTEPLKMPAKPPSLARRAIMRATANKVWFRVGWTCPHLKAVLESAEKEMLLKGELAEHLDIYQLQGNASQSAGTHSLPGAADLAQTSDAQIDILRLNGGDFQKRTPAQGFVLHAHGFAQGCNCGSSGLLYQKRVWNQKDDGLVSHGTISGRWPTKDWQTAVAERGRIIMALADDIAQKAAARTIAALLPAINAIPDRTINGVGINVSTDPKKPANWTLGHIVSWVRRSLASKDQVAALDAKVNGLSALVNGLVKK